MELEYLGVSCLTEASNVSTKVLLELEAAFFGVRVNSCCTQSFATLFEATWAEAKTWPLLDWREAVKEPL